MVPATFDTFSYEIAKLSFMTEVLTSVALEWATQSNKDFYIYFEAKESN
jgi:hypothetical protein